MRPLAESASEADRILVAAHATPVPPRPIGGLAINRQIGEAPPHPAPNASAPTTTATTRAGDGRAGGVTSAPGRP